MKGKNIEPKQYLFVDGYNIINCWKDLRPLSQVNLEVARNELIDMMVEYQNYTGIKVTVVFDAHMVKKNSGKKEIVKGIQVIYTKQNETADQYIERTLDSIGKIKRVRVATSDWMEQQVVLGRGGTRISARELEAEIKGYKKILRRKSIQKNEENDLIIGRLDKKTIKKLQKFTNNGE